MRLWSIHPGYLDSVGLVALWRESLLAQKVLLGQTKGYKFHPQLARFQACQDPVLMISGYLSEIVKEALRRNYRFDDSKIVKPGNCEKIKVQQGQIDYEWQHLQGKLQARSVQVYEMHKNIIHPQPHPLFEIVPGGIEEWERTGVILTRP